MISTAVMFLLLGTTLPAFAQSAQEDKSGAAPNTPQAQQQAQPQPTRVQHAQAQDQPTTAQQPKRPAQPQRAKQVQPQPTTAPHAPQTAQPQAAADSGGGQYGRITSANYGAYFGRGHSFHMMQPQMTGGYNRFHYGGYQFGFNQGWPVGWNYRDSVYVVYDGGAYYLYDRSYPGIHITLSMF
jgi:outer membrane biosynthesis protein TonB